MFAKVYLFLLLPLILAACGQPAPVSPAVEETAAAAPTATPTPIPPPAAGTLSVVPQAELGPISPYLLGSNYGPWIAVPVDMLPAAYDSGVTAIRFPGGEWGDRNEL